MRFPKAVGDTFSPNNDRVDVVFNGDTVTLTLDKTRTYLGKVTEIYKKAGLIAADGTYKPYKALWEIKDDGSITVNTVEEDSDDD